MNISKPLFLTRRLSVIAVPTLLLAASQAAVPHAPVVAAERAPGAPKAAALAMLTIPAPPVLPTTPLFADEVSGRHLLYDTRTAYRSAVGAAFTAHWTIVSGGIGESVPVNRTGIETVRVAASERKLSIQSEFFLPNGEHEIRRAGSDGSEITTTHFIQDNATAEPRRTWARLTLDEGAELTRSLAQIQVNPRTRAADYAIDPHAYVAGPDAIIWQSGEETMGGVRGEFVNQVESQNPDSSADQRRAHPRICRYLIEPRTHRLLRFEEWEIDADRARPARRQRVRQPNGTTTVTTSTAYPSTVAYRREDYTAIAVSAESVPAGAPWALSPIPANYVEKPLPTVDLPPMRKLLAPDTYDPRALKLLDRWRAARDRFVSLSTEVEVTDRAIPRTSESRPLQRRQQDTTMRFQVLYRRPAKARIVVSTLAGDSGGGNGGGGGRGGFRRGGGGGGAPVNGTAISDGETVTYATEYTKNSLELRNPNRLFDTVVRLGLRTQYDVLGTVFNQVPAPENYDKITYDGSMMLDGREPVEVITLRRLSDQRNGTYQAETTIQYFFGSDGLPRVIETKSIASMSGRLERDQPPTQTIDVRFVNMVLDSNPPSTAFTKL